MTRTITLRPIHLLLAVAIAGAALAVGFIAAGGRPDPGAITPAAAAIVDAADPGPGTVGAAPAAVKGAGLLRLLVGRTVRADITATTAAGPKTILYVRGKIDTLTATSLTMALADGTSQRFAVDPQTVVREKGKPESVSDLKAGERAMVFGVKNADGTYTARLIRCITAKAAVPAKGGPSASPGAG